MVALTPKGQFLSHRELIDKVVGSTCRGHGLFGDEADDFKSSVHEKLIEDDYGVFRKFRGNSSLETYLTAVIKNRFRDYRIAKWGKWRPSAKARKMGATAVRLESLLYRDHRSFDEACQILESSEPTKPFRSELARMATQLPLRAPRRFEGEADLAELPDTRQTDEFVLDRERAARWAKIENILRSAIAGLPKDDRLIMKMRYLDSFSVADIARSLGLEQRPLYDRITRTQARLREVMQGEGVTATDVRELVD